MTMTQDDIFTQWQAGDATDIETARALLSDLREVESEIDTYEEQRARIREQLSHIVARSGTIELAGLGRASLTAPTVTKSYDTKSLNTLVSNLVAEGHFAIAQRIVNTQKTTERAGSLRIEQSREPTV